MNPPNSLRLVILLVLYGVCANLAVWGASLLGMIHSSIVVIGLLLVLLVAFYRLLSAPLPQVRWRVRPAKNLIRHGALQVLFLLTLLLLVVAAVLNFPPNNYDHLTYRFPRVLHWFAEGSWHWIPLADDRANYSGVGFEMMWYPGFLLLRSDVFAVILNLAAFASLPALIFRFFCNIGISPRISRVWMWVLPFALCFVLQAAGAGNDLIGAFLILAAFTFLTAKKPTLCAVATGILAGSLATGIKLSNAPLLLPLVPLGLSLLPVLFKKWKTLLPISAAAILVSFLPIAALNQHFTGDFSGDPQNLGKMKLSSPVAGIVGNSLQIFAAAIYPPVNPLAVIEDSPPHPPQPSSLSLLLREHYPRFSIRFLELAGEEGGGIGAGILAFFLFTLLATRKRPGLHFWQHLRSPIGLSMLLVWIAFAVFMAKLGSESSPRIAAPYYPPLLAGIFLFVSPARWRAIKTTLVVGAICILQAWPAIILSPSRPVWPWRQVAELLPPEHPLTERLKTVYTTYSQRADAFAPLKLQIPSWRQIRAVGVLGLADDPETSLWRPFDGRRVVYLPAENLPPEESLPPVIIGPAAALANLKTQLGDSRKEAYSEIPLEITLKASVGLRPWVILIQKEALDATQEPMPRAHNSTP